MFYFIKMMLSPLMAESLYCFRKELGGGLENGTEVHKLKMTFLKEAVVFMKFL